MAKRDWLGLNLEMANVIIDIIFIPDLAMSNGPVASYENSKPLQVRVIGADRGVLAQFSTMAHNFRE